MKCAFAGGVDLGDGGVVTALQQDTNVKGVKPNRTREKAIPTDCLIGSLDRNEEICFQNLNFYVDNYRLESLRSK